MKAGRSISWRTQLAETANVLRADGRERQLAFLKGNMVIEESRSMIDAKIGCRLGGRSPDADAWSECRNCSTASTTFASFISPITSQ